MQSARGADDVGPGQAGGAENVRLLGGCASSAIDVPLVAALREVMPSQANSQQLADSFRLLGDGNRVRILLALLKAGELCVCDLAATVESSDSTVSHALRLLRSAGMVRSRRDGRRVFYALDDGHVRILLELSSEHAEHRLGELPAQTSPGATRPATVSDSTERSGADQEQDAR